MLQRDQGAAQSLDRVDRKHAGRILDLEPVIARPVLHVLGHVFLLGRDALLAELVHRRIDRVEDPADQNGPPLQVGRVLLTQPVDSGKGQIRPGAGIVIKKFYPSSHEYSPLCVARRSGNRQSSGSCPRRRPGGYCVCRWEKDAPASRQCPRAGHRHENAARAGLSRRAG